jgi:hypothetical protein
MQNHRQSPHNIEQIGSTIARVLCEINDTEASETIAYHWI